MAADEEQVLFAAPGGDVVGLFEDDVVEDEQDGQPQRLDDELDEEVGAERHLLRQAEAGEGEEQAGGAARTGHDRNPPTPPTRCKAASRPKKTSGARRREPPTQNPPTAPPPPPSP